MHWEIDRGPDGVTYRPLDDDARAQSENVIGEWLPRAPTADVETTGIAFFRFLAERFYDAGVSVDINAPGDDSAAEIGYDGALRWKRNGVLSLRAGQLVPTIH